MAKTKRKWTLMWIPLLMMLVLVNAGLYGLSQLNIDQWKDFDPDRLTNVEQTTLVYDYQGQLITGLHGAQDRTPVDISKIPLHVRNAFLAAEDARFYQHRGLDIRRIFGALWADIRSGSLKEGASTISQQLIKLSHLNPEKKFARKLQEAYLAYHLEQRYSKDQILEMYLNFIYFGNGAYGVEAASQRYFGKSVSDLTLEEGATLAAAIKAPTLYAPHIQPQNALERRNLILSLMSKYRFISEEQAQAARAKPLLLAPQEARTYPYGYYVDEVVREGTRILGIGNEEFLAGGYRIYTGLNTELQQACEQLVKLETLYPERLVEDGVYPECAAVVLDAQTGAVRALVGGREHTAQQVFNRGTQLRRQPGSAIKPVLVYAPAIERFGYQPTSMLLDQPTDFSGYSPSNFGEQYLGWVTLRTAISRSLNVPAVQVLADIGLNDAIAYARSVGIEVGQDDYNLSIALGGFTKGVSPMMLAGAYTPFANGGTYQPPRCIERIESIDGQVLYQAPAQGQRVLSRGTSFLIADMLRTAVEDGTGKQLQREGMQVCAKTGTVGYAGMGTNDVWTAAFTTEHVGVFWAGYDQPDDQHHFPASATGGSVAARALAQVFDILYAGHRTMDFAAPNDLVRVSIDQRILLDEQRAVLAGAFASQENTLIEWFFADRAPTEESSLDARPQAPAQIEATLADGRVSISFLPVEGISQYRVYRRIGGGQRQIVAELRADSADGPVTVEDIAAPQDTSDTTYSVTSLKLSMNAPDGVLESAPSRAVPVTIGAPPEPTATPDPSGTPEQTPEQTPEPSEAATATPSASVQSPQ